MSIFSIVIQLENAGRLVCHKQTVPRPVHPRGPRTLWMTPETYEWCFSEDERQDARIGDKPLAHLGDQFNAFIRGEFFEYEVDIRRLSPKEADIWEIRSYAHKPQLRVFGWFILPKMFVATNFAIRDDLEKGSGPRWDAEIAKAAAIRDKLVGRVDYYRDNPEEYI